MKGCSIQGARFRGRPGGDRRGRWLECCSRLVDGRGTSRSGCCW